jgi:hypothetical protein
MRVIAMILVSITFFTSCSKVDRIFGNKPYLELAGTNPYELKIYEFTWGYGTVSFNQFSGDFDKLDEKVFDLLKGKEGMVRVYLTNNEKDQYGKATDTILFIGEINLAELNRYEGWEYWHKSAGIQTLLYKKFVAPTEATSMDSAVIEPATYSAPSEQYVDSVGSSGEIYHWNSQLRRYELERKSTPKTFSLEHADLYPDESERAGHDYQSYTQPISGTIKYADFHNGILEVNGDDGDLYALRIQPENLPTSQLSDVRYFMKAGNRIKCVCTVAGARELIIVSVTFTEQR